MPTVSTIVCISIVSAAIDPIVSLCPDNGSCYRDCALSVTCWSLTVVFSALFEVSYSIRSIKSPNHPGGGGDPPRKLWTFSTFCNIFFFFGGFPYHLSPNCCRNQSYLGKYEEIAQKQVLLNY